MEVKDIRPNQGNVDLVLQVVEKQEPRAFEKFGKTGKVCNAKVRDDSGEISLTLWNDDIEKVNVGDKIHLQNGWCSEYRGEKQISAGKFGKIVIVETGSGTVFTNDPGVLATAAPGETEEGDENKSDEDAGEEAPFSEEELVE